MKKLAMFCCAVALGVITPIAILAQSDPVPADTNRDTNTLTDTTGSTTITGKVVSTDASTLVVETDSGNRLSFDTSGNTLPHDATVGSRVQVAYTQGQTGNLNRISTVTVMPSTDTATADSRYGSMGTTGSTGSMDTNRTGTTHTDNPDLYASNSNLPKTGSLMPLLGMLGIFALAAGVAVRIVRLVS
jgi:LPXTG-motif cell wall-anchored protein